MTTCLFLGKILNAGFLKLEQFEQMRRWRRSFHAQKTVETFFCSFFHAASLSLGTLSTKKRIAPWKISILTRNMEVIER